MMCWMIDYYVYYTTNTRGAGIIHHLTSMIQGSRPGATGGIPGRAPPKWLLVPPPPSEDCATKNLTDSGLLECKSTPKLVFFVDWHRISWHFWDEDLFSEITHFRPEKPLEFLISAEKSLANLEKTFSFLLEITCFRPENFLQIWRRPFFVFGDHLQKTAWISDFCRKIPLNLCSSPCSSDPDWDKFLVPPCPSRIHTK